MSDIVQDCARELMDTTPQIVQQIRIEIRSSRRQDLTIPQIRTLRFIQRHPDSSLLQLSEHLGLTPPSASKLVDGLVVHNLVSRNESQQDRRKLTLQLTGAGEEIVNTARAKAQQNLVDKLGIFTEEELKTIIDSMELLQKWFTK